MYNQEPNFNYALECKFATNFGTYILYGIPTIDGEELIEIWNKDKDKEIPVERIPKNLLFKLNDMLINEGYTV